MQKTKLKNNKSLLLLATKHSGDKARAADLMEKIEVGLRQANCGQLLDGDKVFDRLENSSG